MFRFSLLSAIVVLAFGITFALDLRQRSITPPGKMPIVFVSMWAVGEPMQQAYETIFRRFEKEYPSYRVEARWEGRFALPVIRPRILTRSDIPDILNTDLESLQILVDEGYAEPLDSMLRSREHPDDTRQKLWQALNYRLLLYCRQTPKKRYEFDSHKNSDYPHSKVIAAHSSHSDATYLIPAGVWIHLVFYNRLHYERLGLKVPQTWSDFLDNCRQLKSAGITPLASDGYSYAIQWPEIMLARAVGEDTLRRTIKSTGSDFTKDPRYRAVFQAIRDLHQPGWYLDGWQGSRWPAAQRRWIQGEATHMINGSWLLRETNEYKPDPKVIQIGAFPVPLLDTVQNELEISAYAEIPGYSLIKGSGNRQGARMLLRFLMRRNSGSTLAKMGKEISSVVDAEFPDGLNEVKEHLTNSTALLTAGMRSYAPRWYKFVFHENYYPFFLHENPLEEKFLTVEIFLQRLAKDTINQQRHVAVERQP